MNQNSEKIVSSIQIETENRQEKENSYFCFRSSVLSFVWLSGNLR